MELRTKLQFFFTLINSVLDPKSVRDYTSRIKRKLIFYIIF